MSSLKPCIFCDIVAGKSPETIIEFSNEHIVIFKDIRPASDHHYLAVPKNHMHNVRSLTVNDKDLSKFLNHSERNQNIIHLFDVILFRSFFLQFLKCKMNSEIFLARKM